MYSYCSPLSIWNFSEEAYIIMGRSFGTPLQMVLAGLVSSGSGGEDEIPEELGLPSDCEGEKGGDNSWLFGSLWGKIPIIESSNKSGSWRPPIDLVLIWARHILQLFRGLDLGKGT